MGFFNRFLFEALLVSGMPCEKKNEARAGKCVKKEHDYGIIRLIGIFAVLRVIKEAYCLSFGLSAVSHAQKEETGPTNKRERKSGRRQHR